MKISDIKECYKYCKFAASEDSWTRICLVDLDYLQANANNTPDVCQTSPTILGGDKPPFY